MKKRSFVICVRNDGYEASLEVRKVYDRLDDEEAATLGLLRVVDESGDDYLFPEDFFLPLNLPAPLQAKLLETA